MLYTHGHVHVTLYFVPMDPLWTASYVQISEEGIDENKDPKGISGASWKERGRGDRETQSHVQVYRGIVE